MSKRLAVPSERTDDEFLFVRLVEALQRAGYRLDEASNAARVSFGELKPVLRRIMMKKRNGCQ